MRDKVSGCDRWLLAATFKLCRRSRAAMGDWPSRATAISSIYLRIERVFNALYRVPALGGTSTKLIADVDSAVTFSPDGKRLAFLRRSTGRGETAIVVSNADGS